MSHRITTIFFDIGGVLVTCDITRCNRKLQEKIPSLAKQTLSDIELNKQMEAFFATDEVSSILLSADKGLCSTDEFLAQATHYLQTKLGYTGSSTDFSQAYIALLVAPIATNLELLLDLKASRKYKLGIISDNSDIHTDHINAAYPQILSSLPGDQIFLSQQYGYTKAEGPQLYQRALRDLHSAASESLMIDDSPHKLAQAQQLGMRTILYSSQIDLKDELHALGIGI